MALFFQNFPVSVSTAIISPGPSRPRRLIRSGGQSHTPISEATVNTPSCVML